MIAGTTKECLRHYYTHHGNKHRSVLKSFADVTQETDRMWSNGRRLPVGDLLMKLRVFLRLIGYEVAELNRVGPVLIEAAECVVFDLLKQETIMAELKLTEYKFFLRFYRNPGMIPERQKILKELVAKHNDARQALVTGTRARLLGQLNLTGEQVTQSSQLASVQIASLGNRPDPKLTIDTFVSACAIVRSQGQVLLDGSEADRVALRIRMNKLDGEPLLHKTFDVVRKTYDVLHKLLKERKVS